MSDPAGSRQAELPQRRGAATLTGRALAALDAAGLAWVLIRGEPEDPTADLDLIVDDPGLHRVEATWRALGLAKLAGRSHETFLGYDESIDMWTTLDVADELWLGPIRMTVAQVASRAAVEDGLRRPDPADAWWFALLHELADRRRPRPERIHWLRSTAPVAAEAGPENPELRAAIASISDLEPTLRRMAAALATGPQDVLATATHRVQAVLARPRPQATRRGETMVERVLARRRNSPCIALVGPDGVGKSTLAATLRGPRNRPLESIYLGLYGRGAGTIGRSRTGLRGTGLARRMLALAMARVRVAGHRASGRWIVFDRHPVDGLVAAAPAGRLAGWRRRLLASVAPRPDLIVVLDAPADVLLARKREHDRERLEAMRAGYRRLLRADTRARLVAADRPLDEVRRAVQLAIAAWLASGDRESRRGIRSRPYLGRLRTRGDRTATRIVAQLELRHARGMAREILAHRSDRGAGGGAGGAVSATMIGRGHASRSGTCLFPVLESTTTTAYLRLARRPVAVRSVRRAARALRVAAKSDDLEWSAIVPDLLEVGRRGDWSYLLQQSLPGMPASRLPPSDVSWVGPAARAIAGLHSATARSVALDRRMIEHLADRRARRIRAGLNASATIGAGLQSLVDRLHANLAGKELQIGWVHGDFWAGNILVSSDGSIVGVVDWDSAGCPGTPSVDLVHLLAHARRKRVRQSYGGAFVDLLTGIQLSALERSVLAAITETGDEGRRSSFALAWLYIVDAAIRRYPPIGHNAEWVDDMVGSVLPWL